MPWWLLGTIFVAVAFTSLAPVSWAPWVFFGVVGVGLLIWGYFHKG